MKMRKSEERNNRTVHFLFTMSTERKLVEFHKAKTILMKPLAYSLIDSFFFKRRRLFTEVLFRARWFFTSAHKRPGE